MSSDNLNYHQYIKQEKYEAALQILYDTKHTVLSIIFPRISNVSLQDEEKTFLVTQNEIHKLRKFVVRKRIITLFTSIIMLSVSLVIVISSIISLILTIKISQAYLFLLCISTMLLLPVSILLYLGGSILWVDISFQHYGIVAEKKIEVYHE